MSFYVCLYVRLSLWVVKRPKQARSGPHSSLMFGTLFVGASYRQLASIFATLIIKLLQRQRRIINVGRRCQIVMFKCSRQQVPTLRVCEWQICCPRTCDHHWHVTYSIAVYCEKIKRDEWCEMSDVGLYRTLVNACTDHWSVNGDRRPGWPGHGMVSWSLSVDWPMRRFRRTDVQRRAQLADWPREWPRDSTSRKQPDTVRALFSFPVSFAFSFICCKNRT